MKLKSIISKINKNEDGALDKIKVTKYIPFSTKRAIVKNVTALSTYMDGDIVSEDASEIIIRGTGMMKNDVILEELLIFAYKIAFLTDITVDGLLDEDMVVDIEIAEQAYDSMVEREIYDYINEQFVNDDIWELVRYEVSQELEINNSVANVLKTTIEELVAKLPTQEEIGQLMTQIPSQLDGLKNLNILGNKSQKTESIKKD